MSLERTFPKSKWDSPFSRAVIQEEQDAFDFTIYHRDESGKPDFQYKPKDGMTTCVVKSIKIGQMILKHSKASDGLANLAKIYFSHKGRSTDPRRMKEHADTFLEMVQTRFHIVFVDDSLKNPDNWGVHWRNAFTGDFKTSDQSICLNGTNANRMLAAAIVANGSIERNNGSAEGNDYPDFLFQTACTLVHEMGHVFITYLSRGRAMTPPETRAHLVGSSEAPMDEAPAEAGLTLESWIFGSRMIWVRETWIPTRENACGTPYMQGLNGGYYRVNEEVIEKALHCNLELPFAHGPDIETREIRGVGAYRPRDTKTNPIVHPEWPKLRDAPPPTDS